MAYKKNAPHGKKRTGQVYYAQSRRIDREDKKERRRYVVVRDYGKNVSVSKIRGYNNNEKNEERLYPLRQDKYPLSKKSGVDSQIYSRRSDTGSPLRLEDRTVFDEKPSFTLSSHDTHRVLNHVGKSAKKKGRRK